jgi:hypothetical protein
MYAPLDGDALATLIAENAIAGGWTDGGVGIATWPWDFAGGPLPDHPEQWNYPPGSMDFVWHTAGRFIVNAAGKKVWIRAVATFGTQGFVSVALPVFRMFGTNNSYYDSEVIPPSDPYNAGEAHPGKMTYIASSCSIAMVTETGQFPLWLGSPVYGYDTMGNLLIDGSMIYLGNAAWNNWTLTSTFLAQAIECGGTINASGNMLAGYFTGGVMGIRYDGYVQNTGDVPWGLVTADGLPIYMAPGIQVCQSITGTVGVKAYMLDAAFLTEAGAFGTVQEIGGHDCMCLSSCNGSADGQGAMMQSVWIAIN